MFKTIRKFFRNAESTVQHWFGGIKKGRDPKTIEKSINSYPLRATSHLTETRDLKENDSKKKTSETAAQVPGSTVQELDELIKNLEDWLTINAEGFQQDNDRHSREHLESPSSHDPSWIFEISWEVCNKVGGIWTVLCSKAALMTNQLGNNYVVIGPCWPNNIPAELDRFEFDSDPNVDPLLGDAVVQMRSTGHNVMTGRWKVPGNPLVVLVDMVHSRKSILPRYKWELERDDGVQVPSWDTEANDAIVFGYLTAELLAQFNMGVQLSQRNQQSGHLPPGKIVAHFHEWLSGMGVVNLKNWDVPIATVFTTHATLLGRYISAGGGDLLHIQLQELDDPAREANKRGILHRHGVEKLAAEKAEVLTTVSSITGLEAEITLGRRPDVITRNGLNVRPLDDDCHLERLSNRCKIENFILTHFHDQILYKRDKSLFLFSAGRYEYRNKGIDILVDSLAQLNRLLKGSDLTVFCFFIFPTATFDINDETLKRIRAVRQLKKTLEELDMSGGTSSFPDSVPHCTGQFFKLNSNDQSSEEEDEERVESLKKALFYSHQTTPPPITTHNIVDNWTDPLLNHLRTVQLFNYKHDRVKVIFYPRFLTKDGPLLPIDYNAFTGCCDLGIFPSGYEPWGYAPAECLHYGTPAVTTNVSGFGQYVAEKVERPEEQGLLILDRLDKTDAEAAHDLALHLYNFVKSSPSEREEMRKSAHDMALNLLDWKDMAGAYTASWDLALERLTSNADDGLFEQVDGLSAAELEL